MFSRPPLTNPHLLTHYHSLSIRVIRSTPEGRIVMGDSLVPSMLRRFKEVVHEVSPSHHIASHQMESNSVTLQFVAVTSIASVQLYYLNCSAQH